jgi:DNA polymerase-3 subunit chi
MAENDAISASADSNGDGSSPLDASGASSAAPSSDGAAGNPAFPSRVDFYIIEDPSSSARLKLACKLAEKAYLASQSVLVWHTDPAELRVFDEMLWTFNDGSFVPHDLLSGSGSPAADAPNAESPVLLSAGVALSSKVDIIINLAPDLPPCLPLTRRVAEIIDGDDARRRAGRARFKAYRELGVQPASHNIGRD